MKTSEFIKRVEELGYEVEDGYHAWVIRHECTGFIAVHSRAINVIDVKWNRDVSSELFDLCVEYARTPIEEREEEKRYKVRCKLTNRYLDKTFNGKLDWNSMRTSQRIFTLKELEDLGINPEHYDLEEVE